MLVNFQYLGRIFLKMLEKECVYNLRNRNVQRMLWPVDHEQLRIDLKNEQLKIKKEFTQKYNFDFDSEQPLGGKYDWEEVESESPISSPILINTTEVPSCSTTTTTRACTRVRINEDSERLNVNKDKKRRNSSRIDNSTQKNKRKTKKSNCNGSKRSRRMRERNNSHPGNF